MQFVSELIRDLGYYAATVLTTGFGLAAAIYGAIEIVARFLGKQIPNISAKWRFGIFILLVTCAQFQVWRTAKQEPPGPRIIFYEMDQSVKILSPWESLQPVHLVITFDSDPTNSLTHIHLSMNNRDVVRPSWKVTAAKELELRFDGPALHANNELTAVFKTNSSLRVLQVTALRH